MPLSHDLSHLFLWNLEFPASCNKGSNVHGPLCKRQWLGGRRHELMLANSHVYTLCLVYWGILGYTEVYWGSLGYTGVHWGSLGYTGVHWGILRNTGGYWGILGYTEEYWGILGYSEEYGGILRNTGVYWGILGYTEEYWGILGYATCPSVVVWMVLMVPGWSLLTTWQTSTPSMIQSPMSSESCTSIMASMDWERRGTVGRGWV